MSNVQDHVVPAGGQHYSGVNRVPNIKQFMESLDRDKKKRDAEIDNQTKDGNQTGATDHVDTAKGGKNRRTVRDPVTGKDVEISDIDNSLVSAVRDPKVRDARGHRITTPRPHTDALAASGPQCQSR